jgi:hypothetical protein
MKTNSLSLFVFVEYVLSFVCLFVYDGVYNTVQNIDTVTDSNLDTSGIQCLSIGAPLGMVPRSHAIGNIGSTIGHC